MDTTVSPGLTLQNLANIPLSQLLGIGQLDQLVLKSDTLNIKFVKKCYEHPVYDKRPKRFKKSYHCRYDDLVFHIYESPHSKKSENYTIEVNPSQTEGYSQLNKLFEQLQISECSRIARIDFSVLLKKKYFSIEELHLAIRPIYKRWMGRYFDNNVKEHEGHVTGFDFGKYPNRISAYYRGIKDNRRRIKQSGRYLNFELQVRNKACTKIGLETLVDLRKVMTIDPYKWIKFYDIRNINVPRTRNEQERWTTFQELCLRHGVYNARLRTRKIARGNLNRDYDKCFDPMLISDRRITVNEFLLKSLRKSLAEWFRT